MAGMPASMPVPLEPEIVEAQTQEDCNYFYKRLGELRISAGKLSGRTPGTRLAASAPTLGLIVLADCQGMYRAALPTGNDWAIAAECTVCSLLQVHTL